MALKDLPIALEMKDPIHGYISVTEIERDIIDLRLTQRLRYIRSPAGVNLVFPGADTSLMGRLLGVSFVTEIFLENLGANLEEVIESRLAAIILMLAYGPWPNVMEEYFTVRGIDRKKIAKLIIKKSPVTDLIKDSSLSVNEAIDMIEKGVNVKGLRLDLVTTPINPELVDNLERDSYFAGVEYAQLEFRKLFSSTRIAKNRMAFDRSAVFTLDAYLSASANMFDAVYYHKTVRAAELMLLRILDEAGPNIMPSPDENLDDFLLTDDITFHDTLLSVSQGDSEEMRIAKALFEDYRKRYLIKTVTSRGIANEQFLKKLSTPDGLYSVEQEIAEEADIDPSNVWVDYPDRLSVSYFPGKHPMDQLALYERGSRGYEFWRVEEISGIARSFGRKLKTVRVYTTRGYRSKVRKPAENLLESIDSV